MFGEHAQRRIDELLPPFGHRQPGVPNGGAGGGRPAPRTALGTVELAGWLSFSVLHDFNDGGRQVSVY
jgi:hypothetical protein